MRSLLTAVILAAPQPGEDDPDVTGKGPEWGKAAPIGLLVILLLAVAVVFLLRSFTRQLKKVPPSFDTEPEEKVGDPAADRIEPGGRVPASPGAVGAARPPGEPERGPTASDG
jgi:hypothetical protein